MSQIVWVTSGHTHQPCPACRGAGARAVLTINMPGLAGEGTLDLFQCNECRTLFYGGSDPVIGYESADFDNYYWQHYVEVGAGIEAMIRPVTALGVKARGSLLDVGCGFGYVVDFWKQSGRGEAIGLESARYGAFGAEILGAEIIAKYCGECEEIKDRTFSVVYASEVIEHVRDPLSFLIELKAKIAAAGVLVLTTPSADFVQSSRSELELLGPLSAGFHYFLLSRDAFVSLLKKAGFEYVEVQDVSGRLMAWASMEPLPQIDVTTFCWDEYFAYLGHVSKCAHPWVSGGAKYRLFKDSLNTGRQGIAEGAFTELYAHAAAHCGIDLYQPRTAELLRAGTFKEHLAVAPAWLGGALFFGGILGRLLNEANSRNADMLAAASLVLEHELKVGAQFAGEATGFYPLARAEFVSCRRALYVLDKAPSKPDLCIFAHFNRGSRVAPHVLHYLAEIKAADFDIIFVSASDLPDTERQKLQPYVAEIICRENEGWDFASWMDGYRQFGDLARGGMLLLCNDSVIGPLWSLKHALADLLRAPADFFGMVASLQHQKHLQSWFLLLTPSVHQSDAFKTFMSQDPSGLCKREIVEQFELKFSAAMEAAGFRSAALYDPSLFEVPPVIRTNPTHALWKRLITHYRVPFLKIELIRDNPLQNSDVWQWPSIVSRYAPTLVSHARASLPENHVAVRWPFNADQLRAKVDDYCASRGRKRRQRILLRLMNTDVRIARRIIGLSDLVAHHASYIRPRHFNPVRIGRRIRKALRGN